MLKLINRIVAFTVIFCLVFEQSGFAQVAPHMAVPQYLSGLLSADRFRPMHMRSISYDSAAKSFSMLLEKGDSRDIKEAQVKKSANVLMDYFQIGLRLPNSYFWVNLRPDAADQIIDPYLARTDLGKVMLEADLQLKKDLARFTSPDTKDGRAYWDKLYAKAEALFGQDDLEIPTVTRPWIVPSEVIIKEGAGSAYVYKATMKVMLEQDYLKDAPGYQFDDPRLKELNSYSSQLVRELILPKLTREVNSSKRYSGMRQVFYSLVLAQWFKSKYANAQSNEAAQYIDRKDLSGLTSKTAWSKDVYYQAYRKSFAQGEYNKEETVRSGSGLAIRRYFSGGALFNISAPAAQKPIMSIIPAAEAATAVPFLAGSLGGVKVDYSLEQKATNVEFLQAPDISAMPATALADGGSAKSTLKWVLEHRDELDKSGSNLLRHLDHEQVVELLNGLSEEKRKMEHRSSFTMGFGITTFSALFVGSLVAAFLFPPLTVTAITITAGYMVFIVIVNPLVSAIFDIKAEDISSVIDKVINFYKTGNDHEMIGNLYKDMRDLLQNIGPDTDETGVQAFKDLVARMRATDSFREAKRVLPEEIDDEDLLISREAGIDIPLLAMKGSTAKRFFFQFLNEKLVEEFKAWDYVSLKTLLKEVSIRDYLGELTAMVIKGDAYARKLVNTAKKYGIDESEIPVIADSLTVGRIKLLPEDIQVTYLPEVKAALEATSQTMQSARRDGGSASGSADMKSVLGQLIAISIGFDDLEKDLIGKHASQAQIKEIAPRELEEMKLVLNSSFTTSAQLRSFYSYVQNRDRVGGALMMGRPLAVAGIFSAIALIGIIPMFSVVIAVLSLGSLLNIAAFGKARSIKRILNDLNQLRNEGYLSSYGGEFSNRKDGGRQDYAVVMNTMLGKMREYRGRNKNILLLQQDLADIVKSTLDTDTKISDFGLFVKKQLNKYKRINILGTGSMAASILDIGVFGSFFIANPAYLVFGITVFAAAAVLSIAAASRMHELQDLQLNLAKLAPAAMESSRRDGGNASTKESVLNRHKGAILRAQDHVYDYWTLLKAFYPLKNFNLDPADDQAVIQAVENIFSKPYTLAQKVRNAALVFAGLRWFELEVKLLAATILKKHYISNGDSGQARDFLNENYEKLVTLFNQASVRHFWESLYSNAAYTRDMTRSAELLLNLYGFEYLYNRRVKFNWEANYYIAEARWKMAQAKPGVSADGGASDRIMEIFNKAEESVRQIEAVDGEYLRNSGYGEYVKRWVIAELVKLGPEAVPALRESVVPGMTGRQRECVQEAIAVLGKYDGGRSDSPVDMKSVLKQLAAIRKGFDDLKKSLKKDIAREPSREHEYQAQIKELEPRKLREMQLVLDKSFKTIAQLQSFYSYVQNEDMARYGIANAITIVAAACFAFMGGANMISWNIAYLGTIFLGLGGVIFALVKAVPVHRVLSDLEGLRGKGYFRNYDGELSNEKDGGLKQKIILSIPSVLYMAAAGGIGAGLLSPLGSYQQVVLLLVAYGLAFLGSMIGMVQQYDNDLEAYRKLMEDTKDFKPGPVTDSISVSAMLVSMFSPPIAVVASFFYILYYYPHYFASAGVVGVAFWAVLGVASIAAGAYLALEVNAKIENIARRLYQRKIVKSRQIADVTESGVAEDNFQKDGGVGELEKYTEAYFSSPDFLDAQKDMVMKEQSRARFWKIISALPVIVSLSALASVFLVPLTQPNYIILAGLVVVLGFMGAIVTFYGKGAAAPEKLPFELITEIQRQVGDPFVPQEITEQSIREYLINEPELTVEAEWDRVTDEITKEFYVNPGHGPSRKISEEKVLSIMQAIDNYFNASSKVDDDQWYAQFGWEVYEAMHKYLNAQRNKYRSSVSSQGRYRLSTLSSAEEDVLEKLEGGDEKAMFLRVLFNIKVEDMSAKANRRIGEGADSKDGGDWKYADRIKEHASAMKALDIMAIISAYGKRGLEKKARLIKPTRDPDVKEFLERASAMLESRDLPDSGRYIHYTDGSLLIGEADPYLVDGTFSINYNGPIYVLVMDDLRRFVVGFKGGKSFEVDFVNQFGVFGKEMIKITPLKYKESRDGGISEGLDAKQKPLISKETVRNGAIFGAICAALTYMFYSQNFLTAGLYGIAGGMMFGLLRISEEYNKRVDSNLVYPARTGMADNQLIRAVMSSKVFYVMGAVSALLCAGAFIAGSMLYIPLIIMILYFAATGVVLKDTGSIDNYLAELSRRRFYTGIMSGIFLSVCVASVMVTQQLSAYDLLFAAFAGAFSLDALLGFVYRRQIETPVTKDTIDVAEKDGGSVSRVDFLKFYVRNRSFVHALGRAGIKRAEIADIVKSLEIITDPAQRKLYLDMLKGLALQLRSAGVSKSVVRNVFSNLRLRSSGAVREHLLFGTELASYAKMLQDAAIINVKYINRLDALIIRLAHNFDRARLTDKLFYSTALLNDSVSNKALLSEIIYGLAGISDMRLIRKNLEDGRAEEQVSELGELYSLAYEAGLALGEDNKDELAYRLRYILQAKNGIPAAYNLMRAGKEHIKSPMVIVDLMYMVADWPNKEGQATIDSFATTTLVAEQFMKDISALHQNHADMPVEEWYDSWLGSVENPGRVIRTIYEESRLKAMNFADGGIDDNIKGIFNKAEDSIRQVEAVDVEYMRNAGYGEDVRQWVVSELVKLGPEAVPALRAAVGPRMAGRQRACVEAAISELSGSANRDGGGITRAVNFLKFQSFVIEMRRAGVKDPDIAKMAADMNEISDDTIREQYRDMLKSLAVRMRIAGVRPGAVRNVLCKLDSKSDSSAVARVKLGGELEDYITMLQELSINNIKYLNRLDGIVLRLTRRFGRSGLPLELFDVTSILGDTVPDKQILADLIYVLAGRANVDVIYKNLVGAHGVEQMQQVGAVYSDMYRNNLAIGFFNRLDMISRLKTILEVRNGLNAAYNFVIAGQEHIKSNKVIVDLVNLLVDWQRDDSAIINELASMPSTADRFMQDIAALYQRYENRAVRPVKSVEQWYDSWLDQVENPGRVIRMIYEESKGTADEQADGGTTLGGIDMRAMPVVIKPVASSASIGAPVVQLTVGQLEKQWQGIQSKVRGGAMPYADIKAYINACCVNQEACESLKKASVWIAQVLKMEEDAAVNSAPEMKEILALI